MKMITPSNKVTTKQTLNSKLIKISGSVPNSRNKYCQKTRSPKGKNKITCIQRDNFFLAFFQKERSGQSHNNNKIDNQNYSPLLSTPPPPQLAPLPPSMIQYHIIIAPFPYTSLFPIKQSFPSLPISHCLVEGSEWAVSILTLVSSRWLRIHTANAT